MDYLADDNGSPGGSAFALFSGVSRRASQTASSSAAPTASLQRSTAAAYKKRPPMQQHHPYSQAAEGNEDDDGDGSSSKSCATMAMMVGANGKRRSQTFENKDFRFSSSQEDEEMPWRMRKVPGTAGGGGRGGSGIGSAAANSRFEVSECVVPCTISMMQRRAPTSKNWTKEDYSSKSDKNYGDDYQITSYMRDNHSNNDHFSLHGKLVGAVVLRGWVTHVRKLNSQLQFTMSDGTGSIRVHYNNSSAASDEDDDENCGDDNNDGESRPAANAKVAETEETKN